MSGIKESSAMILDFFRQGAMAPDAVPEQFEGPSQDVGIEEGPEVPDVRVVVDGRSTGVERHRPIRIDRLKADLASLEGVVES